MCTLPRNTCRAMVPPISAAAMLSRKLDSTATMTSSTKPPFQSSGRKRGISSGTLALLEMAREQRKAHQQQEQVGEDHPLVLQVRGEARQAGAVLEAGEAELVERDGGKPGQRHLQRVVVEQRDAEQRQREQDEIDRDAGDKQRLAGRGCGHGRRQPDDHACGAQARAEPAAPPPTAAPVLTVRQVPELTADAIPPRAHELCFLRCSTGCWCPAIPLAAQAMRPHRGAQQRRAARRERGYTEQ